MLESQTRHASCPQGVHVTVKETLMQINNSSTEGKGSNKSLYQIQLAGKKKKKKNGGISYLGWLCEEAFKASE